MKMQHLIQDHLRKGREDWSCSLKMGASCSKRESWNIYTKISKNVFSKNGEEGCRKF